MERLTERGNLILDGRKLRKYASELYWRLKQYEDAEEQGLLLRLPIAIGNIVYRINEYADEPIIPMGVTSIEIKGITDTFKEMKCKECAFGGVIIYRFSDIGKTVFLTRAEAEQALQIRKAIKMEDKYLFKAKHIHAMSSNSHLDGTWVKGFLCDENYINTGEAECLIDPATICRCTGRKDEWEHDIFEIDGDRYEIVYCEHSLVWEAVSVSSSESIELGEFSQEEYIRIGNAIDNPELLEV